MHTSLLTLFTDQENLTGNLKAEIPDHFPIFNDSTKQRLNRSNKKVSIRKWGNWRKLRELVFNI